MLSPCLAGTSNIAQRVVVSRYHVADNRARTNNKTDAKNRRLVIGLFTRVSRPLLPYLQHISNVLFIVQV